MIIKYDQIKNRKSQNQFLCDLLMLNNLQISIIEAQFLQFIMQTLKNYAKSLK